MNYQTQLRQPQWKELSFTIKHRDDNTCTVCGSMSRLQAHHKYYLPNRKAWEYPKDALTTLCGDCHKKEEDTLSNVSKNIVMELRILGFSGIDIVSLLENIKKVCQNNPHGEWEISNLLAYYCSLKPNDRLDIIDQSERRWYVPAPKKHYYPEIDNSK